MRRTTLKDIADMAGVSTATVARVLHNNGYVAPKTRELVERAIAETGYQINAVAQGLRRQRTFTIGHVLHSIIPNQFFAAVAEGVEDVASRHSCAVLIVTTHGDAAQERSAVEALIQRRVDAIIFTTASHVDNVRLAVKAQIPVVQVERMTSVETPAVTADNYGGAYAATEHLIVLGHRRIGFIGVDPAAIRSRTGFPSRPDIEQERLAGYLDALRRHGVLVDRDLIGLGSNYTTGANAHHSFGCAWMSKLLELTEPPTAVFATFDLFAAGVLQALYERGLRVPGDISVVGFDDTYARYFSPPLTTVVHPLVEMGRAASNLVLNRRSRASEQVQIVQMPMRLEVRQSSAPPRRVEVMG